MGRRKKHLFFSVHTYTERPEDPASPMVGDNKGDLVGGAAPMRARCWGSQAKRSEQTFPLIKPELPIVYIVLRTPV
jgi:hypothetical protein